MLDPIYQSRNLNVHFNSHFSILPNPNHQEVVVSVFNTFAIITSYHLPMPLLSYSEASHYCPTTELAYSLGFPFQLLETISVDQPNLL